MLDGVAQYFLQRSPTQLGRDALDIFIVYYATYRVLLLVKGTRAQQVALGLLLVFALYAVAQFLQLVTVLSILGSLITSFILIVVVVFQGDIRRGLMRMGSRSWMPAQVRAQESMVIDEVVEAATELARHRIGALITFEQEASLDDFVGVNKGKLLDAVVSSELLVSLFVPEGMNKLHDGAVIIRHLRVGKAGVFFPMPEGKALDQHFGSRHRAAVGITEETDAVVVVVSEERGTISCCFNGNIAPDLNGARLKEMLESIFNPRPRRRGAASITPRPSPTPAPVLDESILEPEAIPEEDAPASRMDPSVAGRPSRVVDPEVPWPEGRAKPDESPLPLRGRVSVEPDGGGNNAENELPAPLRLGGVPPTAGPRAPTEEDGGPNKLNPGPERVEPRDDSRAAGSPPLALRGGNAVVGQAEVSNSYARRLSEPPPPPLKPRPNLPEGGPASEPPAPLRARSGGEVELRQEPPVPLRLRPELAGARLEAGVTKSEPPPPLRPRPAPELRSGGRESLVDLVAALSESAPGDAAAVSEMSPSLVGGIPAAESGESQRSPSDAPSAPLDSGEGK